MHAAELLHHADVGCSGRIVLRVLLRQILEQRLRIGAIRRTCMLLVWSMPRCDSVASCIATMWKYLNKLIAVVYSCTMLL